MGCSLWKLPRNPVGYPADPAISDFLGMEAPGVYMHTAI